MKLVATMKEILKRYYNINALEIVEQRGGWAARAFRVHSVSKKYFFKVYDKARPSTAKWTAMVDTYTPILCELSKSALKGFVPIPVPTLSGEYLCEDENAKYLLYKYIDGNTIGDAELTKAQTVQLGEIVGRLHNFALPPGNMPAAIYEDFEVDFNDKLSEFIKSDIPEFIYNSIEPYIDDIKRLILFTSELSKNAKQSDAPFVFCHTDIHNWNLMQTSENLMLLDWEGLKFAPKEADFFSFNDMPFYSEFLFEYKKYNWDFEMNQMLFKFYCCRRKSEDIWEFLEQLLYEDLSEQKISHTINELVNECSSIKFIL